MLELYVGKDSVKVEHYKRVTPRLRTEFNKLASKLKTDDNDKKLIEALTESGMGYKDGKQTFENPSKLLEYTYLLNENENPEHFEHNYKYQVEIVKLITDESKVSKKLIDAGFEGDYKNEFWQEQDTIEVKNYINSFRSLIRKVI